MEKTNLKKEIIKNKKIIIILSLLILTSLFIIRGGYLRPYAVTYEELYVPTFGYYQCEKQPSEFEKETPHLTIPEEGVTIKMSDFALCSAGDIVTLKVVTQSYPWYYPDRYLYWTKNGIKQPSSGGLSTAGITLDFLVKCNDVLYLEICDWACANMVPDAADYYFEHIPYHIMRYDIFAGGAIPVSGTVDCKITNSAYDTLVKRTDFEVPFKGIMNTQGKRVMIPREKWNYVTSTPVQTLYDIETYQGIDSYCRNRNMYKIGTIELVNEQTVKVAGSGYETKIGSVECCNGEVLPDETYCENHQWVEVQKECTPFLNPCKISDPRRDPDDTYAKTVYWQECIDGSCIRKTKTVQCADPSACPSGYTCDLARFVCVATTPSPPIITPTDFGKKECLKECEQIPVGFLHPFGSLSRQICNFKCHLLDWLKTYGALLVIGIIVVILAVISLIILLIIKRKKRSK